MTTSPIIVSVEGGIGAGKSTLLDKLASRGYVVVPEPVSFWTEFAGVNPLQHFYTDPKRWSFAFQVHVLQTRVDALRCAITADARTDIVQLIVIERSVLSDREVFVRVAQEQGHMSALEAAVYEEVHSNTAALVSTPHAHIYLDVSPETCHARTVVRARDGEASVSQELHDTLKVKHDDWLTHTSIPTLRIRDNGRDAVKEVEQFLLEITSTSA